MKRTIKMMELYLSKESLSVKSLVKPSKPLENKQGMKKKVFKKRETVFSRPEFAPGTCTFNDL